MENNFETVEFILPVAKPELAEILQVSVVTIDRLIAAKKLPHLRVGTSIRFTKANIEEFISTNTRDSKKTNNGEN